MSWGVVFGLAAAVCWGLADFLSPGPSRRLGIYRALFYEQLIGFVGITVFVFAAGLLDQVTATGDALNRAILWSVVVGLIGVANYLSLQTAFATGVMALVSPITASYGAVAALLAWLSGERLTERAALGLGAVMLGVIIASAAAGPVYAGLEPAVHGVGSAPDGGAPLKARRAWLPPGVAAALGAAGCAGVLVWLLGENVTPVLGVGLPQWILRAVIVLVSFAMAGPLGISLNVPRARDWLAPGLIAMLDIGGSLALSAGLARGDIAITAVLSSLLSVVTIFLAVVVLRTRLGWLQWLGVALILVGIVVINLKS